MKSNPGNIFTNMINTSKILDPVLAADLDQILISFFENRGIKNVELLIETNPELTQKIVKNLLSAATFNANSFTDKDVGFINGQLNNDKLSISKLLESIKDGKLQPNDIPEPIKAGNYRKDGYIKALIGVELLRYELELAENGDIPAQEKSELIKSFNEHITGKLSELDASLKEIENKEIKLQYIDTIKRNVLVTDAQAEEVFLNQQKNGISGDTLNKEYKRRGLKTHYKIIEEKLEQELSGLNAEEKRSKAIDSISKLAYLNGEAASSLISSIKEEQEITPKHIVELLVKREIKPKIEGLPEKYTAPLISEMRSEAIKKTLSEIERFNSLEDLKYVENNKYNNNVLHRAVYALNKGAPAFKAEFGDVSLQYLFERNSDKINSFNSEQQTPLSLCTNQEIRKVLVMNGAKIEHAKNLNSSEYASEKSELINISKQYEELTANVKLSITKLFQKYKNSKEDFAEAIVNKVKKTFEPGKQLELEDEKSIKVKASDLHDDLASKNNAINKMGIVDKFVDFLKKFMGNDKFTTFAKEASEELGKTIKGNFTKNLLEKRVEADLNNVAKLGRQ
ncbi:hypothetical protein NF27_DT01290 [Candidatus Jidaibacter acanthamoeba]|uniref:Uncharacterized protein n=1 Tax=Candidatus Jidaibacter acanthamoebae TaxID=86105 RepID=A0A0C1QZC0_9RICK|nr:hypothetical protein [Candidatus Jidaibacter acanthamoeba]KIE05355.1 hypothetical protein NF27_DT01290 [Candidatus Jidaibacter acanthamoeba]